MSWDWQVFCEDTVSRDIAPRCFGTGGNVTYLDWLLSAWGWTCAVSIGALLLALAVGSIIGVLRTLPNNPWLVRLGNAWVELFRNIPLLVQFFIWFFVVPAAIPAIKHQSFLLAVLGLGFFTSARIAEQLRAGIQALPRGQRHAGMALGLTTPQYYRHVLLPMAYRIILPPLTSESMNVVKNSSAAFAVSIPELAQFYLQAGEETSHLYEIYLVVVMIYVVTALVVNRVLVSIEKRTRVPGFVGKDAAGGR